MTSFTNPNHLPAELYSQIFATLQVDDPLSVTTLLSLRLVSSALKGLAEQSTLWLAHAQFRWRRGNRISARDNAYEWYKTRTTWDKAAQNFILYMAKASHGRLAAMDSIQRIYAANALEICKEESRCDETVDPEWWMSRRYWGKEAVNYLLRNAARSVWEHIGQSQMLVDDDGADDADDADDDDDIDDNGDDDDDDEGTGDNIEQTAEFENGVLAFSAYRGHDPEDTSELLDLRNHQDLMKMIETDLSGTEALHHIIHQTSNYMNRLGIHAAAGRNFHNLGNHFLHQVWHEAREHPLTNAGTLPMSMVSIFCSLIQRFPEKHNIRARPVGFPGILIAAVANRDQQNWVYVNVYAQGRILSLAVLQEMVSQMGLRMSDNYLRPAMAKDMCIRVARNILTSVRAGDDRGHSSHLAATSSLYAVASALFILTPIQEPNEIYANWILSLCQAEFPLDVAFIEEKVVPFLPGSNDFRREEVLQVCRSIRNEDKTPPKPKRRLGTDVLWRCGHVFRHRLFGYVAVVRGWDTVCEASEGWCIQMQVDKLPHGRNQPFYHVIVADGSGRYVAQENVTKNFDMDADSHESLLLDHSVGRYFRTTKQCTMSDGKIITSFVKSAELEAAYPED